MDAPAQQSQQQSSSQSVASNESGQQQQPVAQMDLQSLSMIVQEWSRLQNDVIVLRQQMSEKRKRIGVLDQIILNVMKNMNMGALELKNTGGQILLNKRNTKQTLTPKVLLSLMTDFMKGDQTKASEIVKYINDHREVRTTEKLSYEKA